MGWHYTFCWFVIGAAGSVCLMTDLRFLLFWVNKWSPLNVKTMRTWFFYAVIRFSRSFLCLHCCLTDFRDNVWFVLKLIMGTDFQHLDKCSSNKSQWISALVIFSHLFLICFELLPLAGPSYRKIQNLHSSGGAQRRFPSDTTLNFTPRDGAQVGRTKR